MYYSLKKLSIDDNLFGLVLVLLHWDISKFCCTTVIYFCQVKPDFYFDGLPWRPFELLCVYVMMIVSQMKRLNDHNVIFRVGIEPGRGSSCILCLHIGKKTAKASQVLQCVVN